MRQLALSMRNKLKQGKGNLSNSAWVIGRVVDTTAGGI